MILGVTGGIASGKSTVARIFRALGAAVVSADELARDAVRPGTETLARLVAYFGDEILLPTGELNRSRLAERVFVDERARRELNRITHPAIAALAEERLRELSGRTGRLIVYEAPLLFEAKAEKRVDRILVVTIDNTAQIERLMKRDGLDEEGAQARIDAQMPLEEKVARADYVIENSGDFRNLEEKVRSLFVQLRDMPHDKEA